MCRKLCVGRSVCFPLTNISRIRCKLSLSTTAGPLGKGFDILGDNEYGRTQIQAFGDQCFLINDTMIRQSVICTPQSFLLWNVNSFDDITIDSLIMFSLLHPTIEVLFIGCGDVIPKKISSGITNHFKAKGIIIEATTTSNAASTFNILVSEGRNVCAALLPCAKIEENDEKENQ